MKSQTLFCATHHCRDCAHFRREPKLSANGPGLIYPAHCAKLLIGTRPELLRCGGDDFQDKQSQPLTIGPI